MNSKIPIRSTSSKPQARSYNKNERRVTRTQKKDELLRNSRCATGKTDQIPKEGKENKILARKMDNLNNKLMQEKERQELQRNFKKRSKNLLEKNEKDVKQLSCQVLQEHKEKNGIKSDKCQPPKIVIDQEFDFSLKNRDRNPPNPVNIPQTHQNPVWNGKTQKKPENVKPATNHPSQPDIEFVADENCRRRILNGRELSPGILQWPRRTQSSINGRFSIFNKPISTPVNPHKAVLKLLENLKVEDRRSSFRPSSPLDKFGSVPQQTLDEGFKFAMKRLSDLRSKDKPKSTRKVTFKLPHSDCSSKANHVSWKERKQEINGLRLSDMSERSECSSQHSTPELNVKLLPSSSHASDIGRNTVSSVGDAKLRGVQQNSLTNLQKVENVDKKLSSILKSRNTTEANCNERHEFRVLSFNLQSRKLRRSLSASELNHSSFPKSAALNDAPSQFSCKVGTGESDQVGGSESSQPSSNNCNFNTLRSSISSPELNNRFLKADDGQHAPSKQGYNKAVADIDEKRMSRILAFNFWSKKPRRSMSASELSSSSMQVQLKDKSSKAPNKVDGSKKTCLVGGSKSPHQSSNICNFNMLRTSISSPELSDRFCNAENGKLFNCVQNVTNVDKMPSSILRNDNVAAIDYDERRKSEFLASCFKSKKLRRSTSVSELDLPSTTSTQTALKNASPEFLNKMCGGTTNDQIESSPLLFSSPDICNLGSPGISISSPELREIFPVTPTENKTQNPPPFSQNRAVQFRPHNLSSLVKGTEPRSSLYLSCSKNKTRPTYSPKLCTPCPVSLNPMSRVANSFSPEFLCRRTSNILSHAPIRTPLVMRHLADNDELDEEHQSPVRQKLDFGTVRKDKDDSKRLSLAYLQSFKTQQKVTDLLADQECCTIWSLADSPQVCTPTLVNPIAKTLDYGDEMHFVPLVSPLNGV